MTNECAQIIDKLIQERERQGWTQKAQITEDEIRHVVTEVKTVLTQLA